MKKNNTFCRCQVLFDNLSTFFPLVLEMFPRDMWYPIEGRWSHAYLGVYEPQFPHGSFFPILSSHL